MSVVGVAELVLGGDGERHVLEHTLQLRGELAPALRLNTITHCTPKLDRNSQPNNCTCKDFRSSKRTANRPSSSKQMENYEVKFANEPNWMEISDDAKWIMNDLELGYHALLAVVAGALGREESLGEVLLVEALEHVLLVDEPEQHHHLVQHLLHVVLQQLQRPAFTGPRKWIIPQPNPRREKDTLFNIRQYW